MKRTIRVQFFAWLGVQTAIVFLAIAAVLLVFNVHERHEHPDLRAEESREALVVAGAMLLLFPVALASAWFISRRLLRPWQRLVAQAERIGAGHLDERIDVADREDEIGRLAAMLNTAFDGYEHLLERMHRFSFDASHQLRNPLASIRASGEICLQQARAPAEYEAAIGGMLEDTARLGRTVEQLLLMARASEGALDGERETFDAREVVGAVAAEARGIGEARGVEVVEEAPAEAVPLRAVRELVRQGLTNLVDNALRFTPDGGRIVIGITAHPGGLRFRVQDTGPGPDPARRATLFRPFARDRGAGRESAGLGLAIVADICRAHGGAAGLDDGPAGPVFWMEFPPVTGGRSSPSLCAL